MQLLDSGYRHVTGLTTCGPGRTELQSELSRTFQKNVHLKIRDKLPVKNIKIKLRVSVSASCICKIAYITMILLRANQETL